VSTVGGDDLLTHIETKLDPKLGQLLRRYIIPAINNLGDNVGASPNGFVSPPPPPQGVTINKIGPENLQFTVQHTSPIPKGIHYFTEMVSTTANTQPSFVGARVEHHGTSRSPISTAFCPTKDSSGNTHNYYFRSYAQMPGGQRSGYSPVVGPITMSGTTEADHTPSTGSGTAAADGSQPGQGFGNNLLRPAPAAKRTV
jgi:hypothetical protein